MNSIIDTNSINTMQTRIYLRAFELDDYKTTIAWRNDKEVSDKLGGMRLYVSEAREKKWIEDTIFHSSDIKLAICLIQNNLHIGNVYLTDINNVNRTAESHILIGNKDYWGQGYACEALLQMLHYGFEERGLNRIYAHINIDNEASLRMHEKCGYKQEGVLRQAVFKNGTFKDVVVMSILSKEFLK